MLGHHLILINKLIVAELLHLARVQDRVKDGSLVGVLLLQLREIQLLMDGCELGLGRGVVVLDVICSLLHDIGVRLTRQCSIIKASPTLLLQQV
jgi:hypothetical protein